MIPALFWVPSTLNTSLGLANGCVFTLHRMAVR
jgi:hypothetical protein